MSAALPHRCGRRSVTRVNRCPARRAYWERVRGGLEGGSFASGPDGLRAGRPSGVTAAMIQCMGLALRLTGLERIGRRNALAIGARDVTIGFPDLPRAFDGYRLLHVTDPHFDMVDGLAEAIARCVRALPADLCVMTGDYRAGHAGDPEAIQRPLRTVLDSLQTPEGVVATLGNHDDLPMARMFETMGLTVLANETLSVRRGADALRLIGVDDPHRYYTPMADQALRTAPEGFRIALVHSPELADRAAAAGCALYVCGHTHGGQICRPDGRPLATHLLRCRDLDRGLWRLGAMRGYTSAGAGVSALPARFFSRGEVTRITLRRQV